MCKVGSRVQYLVEDKALSYLVLGYSFDHKKLILGRIPSLDLTYNMNDMFYEPLSYLQVTTMINRICNWRYHCINASDFSKIIYPITNVDWEYTNSIKSYFKDEELLKLPKLYE